MHLEVNILETFTQVLMRSGTENHQLKNIHAKYYTSDCYDANVNKYKVKTGISLRF